MSERYSVLMSVYYREKPEYLRESLMSIYGQTVPADDVVLVCDGPLIEGLDAVIDDMKALFGERLLVHRLEKNVGLGKALNEGIKYCGNDLVARMDSDDISRPERCGLQLWVFEEHPELSIVSGTVEEFSSSPDVIEARRVLPETNEEILKFAKTRNPFNHPCVMYRKSAVKAAGGYLDFYLLEDYYLWIRMLTNGARGYNLQQPLLWMRAGSAMYSRRGGLKYAKSQAALFRYMRDEGFISPASCFLSTAKRGAASLIPSGLRKTLFTGLLRKK
ncbi:MAG: glycosyltransferase [Firmicutes bacterium]|nr:glycosyltransferase [Bacillota bacterium]